MITIWCVPENEAARFAHEIIRAETYFYAHEHQGGVPISSTDCTAILYIAPLIPHRIDNSERTTDEYPPWILLYPDDPIDVHVVVEPAFANGFIGREAFTDRLSWRINDLQMDRAYLKKYEGTLGAMDSKIRRGLTYGAYIAKKSGQTLLSTQISLMRRQALGVPVSASDVGNPASIFELIAGGPFSDSPSARLRSLAHEIRLFVKVYREADILLRFLQAFLLGALNHMKGSEVFVRGPRAKQYDKLTNLSPAQMVHALDMLDRLPLPADSRILAVAEYLIRGIGETAEISLHENSTIQAFSIPRIQLSKR